MKTIVRIMVAAIVATGMACVLMMHDASDNVVILTTLCVAIIMAALLGVFDTKERKATNFDTISRRSYGHAAVFIGTACVFMGTPQDCEEMADDLQHYGQQARMEMLTGSETFEIL